MKKVLIGLVLTITLLFAGCNGGGGGGGGYGYTGPGTIDSFVYLLEDTYGGDFSVVKTDTLTQNFVVVFDHDMGKYYAYDLHNYIAGDSWSTYLGYSEYDPVFIHDWYVEPWGETVYVGDAFDSYGYAGEFLFEETEMAGKDLEKLGAFEEAYNVAGISKGLVAEYGLSEQRSQKIAKMAMEWKKLSKSRSMTDADASAFTKELVGVELSEASDVMKKYFEGNTESLDDFINSAAEVNGTTPEQMNSIINDFVMNN